MTRELINDAIPKPVTTFTVADEYSGECRADSERAVDAVQGMMENASYNERRMAQRGTDDWPDGHGAQYVGWAREYLGCSVEWETK